MCFRDVLRAMNVRVLRGKAVEAMELPEGSTAERLCSLLGLLPDANIILRNDVPIPIDEVLHEGETIRIIKVASGG